MLKKQPTPQATRQVKSSVKPTEPSIPESIAELLARALARLNGATVPVARAIGFIAPVVDRKKLFEMLFAG